MKRGLSIFLLSLILISLFSVSVYSENDDADCDRNREDPLAGCKEINLCSHTGEKCDATCPDSDNDGIPDCESGWEGCDCSYIGQCPRADCSYNTKSQACEYTRELCEPDGIRSCYLPGQIQSIEPPLGIQKCTEECEWGECEQAPCSEENTKCPFALATTQLICKNNKWVEEACPSGEYCVGDQKSGSCECEPEGRNRDCEKAGKKYCDKGKCVECKDSGDCELNEECTDGKCVCILGEYRCSSVYGFKRERCVEIEGQRDWRLEEKDACFENCRKCDMKSGQCKGEQIGYSLCEKHNDIFCQNGVRVKCEYCFSRDIIEICESGKCRDKNNCEPPQKSGTNQYSVSGGVTYFLEQTNQLSYNGYAYQFPDINLIKEIRSEFKLKDSSASENTFLVSLQNNELADKLNKCNIITENTESIVLTHNGGQYDFFCNNGGCDIKLDVSVGSVLQDSILTIKKLKLSNCEKCGDFICEINAGENPENCAKDCKKCMKDINCRIYCGNTVISQGLCIQGVCSAWKATGEECDEDLTAPSKDNMAEYISLYYSGKFDLDMLLYIAKNFIIS